jgi:hypothetical protein
MTQLLKSYDGMLLEMGGGQTYMCTLSLLTSEDLQVER